MKKTMSKDKDKGTKTAVGFRKGRKKKCGLCLATIIEVDYKDVNTMKRYMTDRGKITPRRNTGLCPKHQRSLASAVKRSREIGLAPYVLE